MARKPKTSIDDAARLKQLEAENLQLRKALLRAIQRIENATKQIRKSLIGKPQA